uniref:Uncharacterized protein n=1 Tax=viral metagenome TaxID=1070528 RepID=A0A6C0AP22_9ZZZZ
MATASGVMGPKQTKGYFVVLSSISTSLQYNVAAGSGAGGSYQPGAVTTQAAAAPSGVAVIPSGTLLKDMGKTVVSSTHTFRKVQTLLASGPSITATAAATGLPFYIELSTGQSLSTAGTQVAYMPGLF